ncbi:MAG: Methyltransferase family protein [Parcubacteria group bacterium GW2011_GWC1_43_61]|uniref:Methyltransferase type 12 n=1 Tax=Candidatus Shapirobacteria bacterium GW2011_GWE1_38_92 TaxID=1618489 RepID=A0A0G0PU70_9BACT|nr:MAG: Methyltransferase type 12 [Candidatus Shapirobacteria bacterium GW2011_GWE1_38_92]KKR85393.1 MAG: Methyltransferase type 12 [Candidatus Azambacteria bacterium GW2011_GWF1_41_10]KKS49011.1 MAG: Methyltransferase type 12 [Candidatus Azambacteria bacterium GW2011_GWF2_42_22]KKS69096.1 MAG: Methyltransferase type 12 [Candidatus Azambacteria bacterium GW2011_GWA2_42_62]KKS73918.1 MAG: Methyltransferase type 12 [Candidatus Azambacteria bacterium GW2011_GWB1_42_72]KKT03171.1 MAG: Methyltransf
MSKNFAKYFQKIKWDVLARIKPNYFIYSDIKNNDESKYINSGREDVQRLIINDDILKSKINFSNSSILEIGCGNGRMSQFLSENFKKVYAVDISPRMIGLARQRLESFENIEFLTTNGSKLPIQNNAVDFVFSYIVFQHFPNLWMVERNLREIKRVLKDDGIAKIQFRGKISSGGIFRMFKWYYGVFFSEKELNNILVRNELRPLKIYKGNEKELWAIFGK